MAVDSLGFIPEMSVTILLLNYLALIGLDLLNGRDTVIIYYSYLTNKMPQDTFVLTANTL